MFIVLCFKNVCICFLLINSYAWDLCWRCLYPPLKKTIHERTLSSKNKSEGHMVTDLLRRRSGWRNQINIKFGGVYKRERTRLTHAWRRVQMYCKTAIAKEHTRDSHSWIKNSDTCMREELNESRQAGYYYVFFFLFCFLPGAIARYFFFKWELN